MNTRPKTTRISQFAGGLTIVAALFMGAPQANAGLIPFVYNSIFGYGPAWGGYPGMHTAGYGPAYSVGYGPAYSTGYGPATYSTSYGYAPNFTDGFTNTGYGYAAGYGPGYYGGGLWGASYGPVGCGCSPCECGSCLGGCGSCAGGDCASGDCGANYQPSVNGSEPTPADSPNGTPPADDFTGSSNSNPTGSGNSGSTIPTNPGTSGPGGWTAPAERPSSSVTPPGSNMLGPRPAPGEPGGSTIPPASTIPPGSTFPPNSTIPPASTIPPGGSPPSIFPGGTNPTPPGTTESRAVPVDVHVAGSRFNPTRGRTALRHHSDLPGTVSPTLVSTVKTGTEVARK
ncbi:MAG: hypothetical protein H6824_18135 [Planctomycetaceae bacterium]|nr:hypothetical protein [Planctomycetaceae bacterium]